MSFDGTHIQINAPYYVKTEFHQKGWVHYHVVFLTQSRIPGALLKDGGIFVDGIHLHSLALNRHDAKSEIEEVFVCQEFHRPGIPGLIRWTSTFPVDSKMIEIQGEEVIRYPTSPIGTATILKLSNGWDWDGDICTNQAEPVFISRVSDGCQELFKISSDALKSDNL